MVYDNPVQKAKVVEAVISKEGDLITQGIKDEDLIRIINFDINRHDSRFKELIRIAEKNERYWEGRQLDYNQLAVGEPDIVSNRIMVSVETIVSIITSVTPEPWIVVSPKNTKGRMLKDKLRRKLRDMWEYELKMQQVMERVLRNHALSRVAFVKWGFDDNNEPFTDLVRLESVRFDLDARSVDESSFFAHYIEDSLVDMIRKFPDKEKYLRAQMAREGGGDRSVVRYVEYWGTYMDEDGNPQSYVCWKHLNEILGKEFNPLWNEEGKNHFKTPKKPFIAMNSMSLGKSIVDDTSTVEQAIPLQDAFNRRKRQIDRNAWMANGIFVATAAGMERDTFDSIDGDTTKVWLDNDVENIDRAFKVITGRPFESGIFTDMQDSAAEIDNIFGTHSTTRGESERTETLGGRALLRDADYGRQDLTARSYEQVAEDIYNAWVQMMYLMDEKVEIMSDKEEEDPMEDYKKEKGYLPAGDDDCISPEELEEYKIKIIVKRGTTRPDDPAQSASDAVMLLQTGMLDPQTFGEMYDLPNPRKFAKRAYLWQDPNRRAMLFPELEGDMGLVNIEAIRHIRDINNGAKANDSLYKDFQDLDDLKQHVETHKLYMQGAEIDPDLKRYDDLDEDLKLEHKKHLKFESDALKMEVEAEAANNPQEQPPAQPPVDQQMGGQMPPEMGQMLPPEQMGQMAQMP